MPKSDTLYLLENISDLGDFTGRSVEEVLSEARLDGEGALTQQIYRLMRTLIIDLRLLPNQLLSEKDVAVILNLSRTPVREAFIRLSEDGLLNVVPKSGTYVSPIDLNRAYEGYLMRISLESTCAALLAERRDAKAAALLRQELAKQKRALKATGSRAFTELDKEFHGALFVAANLPNLKRLVDAGKFEVDRIKNLKKIYQRAGRTQDALLQEHTAIVDAIASGNAEKAKRLVADHFRGMNESLEAMAKEERLWGMFHILNYGTKSARRGR